MRYLPVFEFLFLLVVITSCTKEKFPRISKCKIEINAINNCKVDFTIVDLSDKNQTEYGILIDTFANSSSSSNSKLGIKKISKGNIESFNLNALDCTKKYFLRPYIKEENKDIFGETLEFQKSNNNNLVGNISSSAQKGDSILVYYSIPIQDCLSLDEIILCYVFNSNNDPVITNNPIKLKNTSGGNMYSFLTPKNGNGKYKFRIFIKYCNSVSISNVNSIDFNTPSMSCNAELNSITFFQKSLDKFSIKGSITKSSALEDYGFIVNSNKKISLNKQPLNNLDTIYIGAAGTYMVQLFYKCFGMDQVKGPIFPFSLTNRTLSIGHPSYISNNIVVNGNLLPIIPDYMSMQYGLCYSTSNKLPSINDTKVNVRLSVVSNPLNGIITSPSQGQTYYMRFYVTDCDTTFYSDTTSIYIPIASGGTCNFKNEVLPNNNIAGYINPATFVLNGTIYVGGGNTGTLTIDILLYLEKTTNLWRSTANRIPISSGSSGGVAASFAIGNIGYILERGATYLYPYDATNDRWLTRVSYPGSKIEYAIGESVNNKGYIIGGQNHGGTKPPSKNAYEYDPISNKFTPINYDSQLGDRVMANSFVINGLIYVFGGDKNVNNDLWVYNPSNDQWSTIQNNKIPSDLIGSKNCITSVLNGKAYVINVESNFQISWEYDPAKSIWTQCSSGLSKNGTYGFGAYSLSNSYIGYFNSSKIELYKIY